MAATAKKLNTDSAPQKWQYVGYYPAHRPNRLQAAEALPRRASLWTTQGACPWIAPFTIDDRTSTMYILYSLHGICQVIFV